VISSGPGTPAELQALADRWGGRRAAAAEIPYREIHRQTGVSVTTIGGSPLSRRRQWRLRPRRPSPAGSAELERQQRLRIAIQKSGRLTITRSTCSPAVASSTARQGPADVATARTCRSNVLFVRDDDIPDLVQEDVLRPRAVGNQRHRGKRPDGGPRRQARFELIQAAGLWSLPAIAAVRTTSRTPAREHGRPRIATTLPTRAARFLRENSIAAEIVTLSGAVENSPTPRPGDLICDLVSTGSTLTANTARGHDRAAE